MGILPKLTIAQKLPLALIGSGLLIGAGIGFLSYFLSAQIMGDMTQERLRSVATERAEKVESYLAGLAADISRLATTDLGQKATANFDINWSQTENPGETIREAYITQNPHPEAERALLDISPYQFNYNFNHTSMHPGLRSEANARGYGDIIIVNPKGDVVYSVDKHDELGTNVAEGGPYADSGLGQAFRAALASQDPTQVFFADDVSYAPAGGSQTQFIATPVLDQAGKFVGVIAVIIPEHGIDLAMASRNGLGTTGEAFIIGPDYKFRSDSVFTEGNDTLVAEFHTPEVDAALAGMAAQGTVASHRDMAMLATAVPVNVLGNNWALVSLISRDEALAPDQRAPQSAPRDRHCVAGRRRAPRVLPLALDHQSDHQSHQHNGRARRRRPRHRGSWDRGPGRSRRDGAGRRSVPRERNQGSQPDGRGARGIRAAPLRADADDAGAADMPSAKWSMRPMPATSRSGSRPSSPIPSSTRSRPRSTISSRPSIAACRRPARCWPRWRSTDLTKRVRGTLSGRVRAAEERHQRGRREADRDRQPAARHVAGAEDRDRRNPCGRQRSLRAHHQAGGDDRGDVGGDGAACLDGAAERPAGQGRQRRCRGRDAHRRRGRAGDAARDRGDGADHHVVGQDLQHHRADRRHRVPDQPPGAQRLGRGGAGRGGGQGLCGGRGRSAAAGAVGGQGIVRGQGADRAERHRGAAAARSSSRRRRRSSPRC